MRSWMVVFLFVGGCLHSEVARGPDTPEKRATIEQAGLIDYGEWHFSKLRGLTRNDRIYALRVDREGGQLIAHCAETVYEYPGINNYGGPWEERMLPWRECTHPLVLSLLGRIEA